MSVQELEKAVAVLSPEELREFRAWFADFDMAQWDRQIEQDSNAGRLDHFINKAMEDYRAGKGLCETCSSSNPSS
jgi:predicted esterase